MASDGKVVISTALDNDGIRKGVKEIKGELGGLNSVLKTLGATIAAVFSVHQIVSFMVDSSKAARELSDALTGLRSILEGQGRSFSDAEKFLQEYTADGLIPMTNAITTYKNLASRGYDDSQIRQVMTALKDASAYGRQASMTMGEAVQSASEGLKNENSILVDNAGVTKNVAKMWEEYAESIGTTANNLTQAQKIQAEVNGILEETKYQTGDAATVAGTLSGQLQQLSFNFNNLKEAVGDIINPIAESFLPIINTAIAAVTRLANALATVIGLVFGKASASAGNLAESNDAIASSASAGAEAEQELADATTAAGKAAKKSLASFDELNKLQGSSSGGTSSSVGGGVSAGGVETEASAEVEDTVSPKLQAIADKIRVLLTPLTEVVDLFRDLSDVISGDMNFSEFLGQLTPIQTALLAIAAAFGAIKIASASITAFQAITGFLASVKAMNATGLVGKLAELVAVLGGAAGPLTSLSDALQMVFGTVATAIAGIGSVIGGVVLAVTNFFSMLEGGFSWAKEALMLLGVAITTVGAIILGAPAGVAAAIGAIVAVVATAVVLIKENWATISDWFDKNVIQPISEIFSNLWDDVSTWASEAWDGIMEFFAPAIEWFGELLGSVEQTFDDIFYNIGVIASGCWDVVKAAWDIAAGWFDENVAQPVSEFFSEAWENVKQGAADAWAGIESAFSDAATFFGDIFSDAWTKVCEVFSPFGEIFTDIKDGILTAFKDIVNGIIRGLNSAIAIPFNGINAALTKIKEIKILGLAPFSGLRKISVPQIPYLAQGAVLPANKPFLAMVGDQKHGTNIEAPLSTIQEAVAIVMEDMVGSQVAGFEAVVSVLQEILEAVLGIEIDGETLSKAVENYTRKMSVVRGG